MSIFETLMLVCFGAAWPFSIYRSYTSRSTKGKSLLFLIILLFGYVSGITHKLLYSFDLVIILYVLNLIMVCIDTLLYFRNARIEKQRQDA
ncbi:MAG: hypothetical protein A2268_06550 [Candidatus Raymondbacteria bacterium RifOxyA12_full_50_37]|uniref:PQ-loop repeat-containing protein n=1 Tax=Candidatus Raymondbacteria bacterium RIFOXYD12_FULL_49_13 TaxID=1817890 RepID=A0A1F7EZG6_UNCRA|nr:MAG: hypothetical protein A2350_02410 [Candidatus Raymondbacteria bacterium RifOxyB12_full_50_8]OGJ92186.1 MAG: hypothetical protein A2268_06550 [Candidatus Raymondbacteria bacterium RifOxyA12_full_50_37]OGJ94231.1 MAG: hypothetical protein A2487_17415 [Candidatus Raymondbacteria bacterium RifOxyC12_full_50_8]OGJ94469.1 MAG: hypothetical protein A2248_15480 [Candidatus Raymondbacteria bacterium RIFOXYA2_FULL_49_16]OGJ99225.1 MAG: hypothetical protein A2453_07330 [Candidatus Raymondbacteria b